MPLIRQCKICGADFKTKPFFIKNGGGKYCSVKCQSEGRRKGKWIECFICGEKAYKQRKDIVKSQTKNFFCSKKCSIKWQNTEFVGRKHPNWKFGEYSYKSILKKQDVIQSCLLCNTKQKKVLAVHHIDKNRKNNNIDNLAWLCHNCHHLVHHYKTELERFAALVKK